MQKSGRMRWDDESEVVVVGYGGAGAVSAIAAHDAGAKVLILEKQACDTPTRTRHTPNTRMSGGGCFCPSDAEGAARYLRGMHRLGMESMTPEREKMISVFAEYLVDVVEWIRSIGVRIGGWESFSPTVGAQMAESPKIEGYRVFSADYPELSGSESSAISFPETTGAYRHGAALFKGLSEAVQKRSIPISWGTAARHLLRNGEEVCGVVAEKDGNEVRIRARRAVILTCGGFEFNESMKENYLRVNPSHFYGTPANTGDGLTMAMEMGASLWHMNDASWRVTMKFPDHPIAFGTQRHETASIFVDKRGNRFANERFKMHGFGYELTNFDCYVMCYPKVPCYWIFNDRRRTLAPLASYHGASNPPGGVIGDIHYIWSPDNQKEIERGWIMEADSIENLAHQILKDPDNNGLMNPSVLVKTLERYNRFCEQGQDADFGKPEIWMEPLESPPFFAVKLWPGGPNTQGGPERNIKAQVMRLDRKPIPRLYSAGELGSFWGMFCQGGGNISECIVFGRIAGSNAAGEKRIR